MFFSIIIPTYNRAHLILNTLNSVINQLYCNFELLIIDDGSTDNTKEIINEFIKSNQNINCIYLYKDNGERGMARNYGISMAKGNWITFLDSDDIIYPNHLQLAFNYINNQTDVSIFHSAYEFRDENNNLIRVVHYPQKDELNRSILDGNILSCFGMFIKKEVFKIIKFDENRYLSGTEDWLLWLQLSARFKINLQPLITGCIVQHKGRSVLNFNEIDLKNRTQYLIDKLNEDHIFIEKWGNKTINKIHSHMHTYSALHLILSNNNLKGLLQLYKGFCKHPPSLLNLRTMAILKHLLLNSLKK